MDAEIRAERIRYSIFSDDFHMQKIKRCQTSKTCADIEVYSHMQCIFFYCILILYIKSVMFPSPQ